MTRKVTRSVALIHLGHMESVSIDSYPLDSVYCVSNPSSAFTVH